MKKRIFGVLMAVFLGAAGMLQAQDWYVCLGSFRNRANAQGRVLSLAEDDISAFVYEHNDSGSVLYRVLYFEKSDNIQSARACRDMLLSIPSIKRLGILDAWCVQAEVQPALVQPPVVQNNVPPALPPLPKTEAEKKDGERFLTIKDSDTGKPISEANVNIDKKWDVVTDVAGKAPLPDEVQDGEHSLVVTKGDEYVPTEGQFVLDGGQIASAPQISVPKTVEYNRIKIILDWGENPYDLDSHIFNDDCHVSYWNMSENNLSLDRDDIDGYGPETVTIREPEEGDIYRYYVFNYSDGNQPLSDTLSYSEAQVKVYFNNEFQASFKIGPNQKGILWHVFDIVNGNEIISSDEVIAESDSRFR